MSRRSPWSIASTALLILVTACDSQPAVEMEIRIGEKLEPSQHAWAKADEADHPDPQVEAAKQVIQAIRDDWRRAHPDAVDEAQPANASDAPGVSVTEPPRTREQYQDLIAALRDGPIDEVAMPAHNLRQVDAALWPELRELILGPRKGSKTEFTRILSLIGGDVPNRYGHFALHWKKSHGYNVKVSEDWFKDLLSLPLGKVSGMLHPVYRDAVLTVAALHGASRIGRENPELTGEVVETLLDAAYMHRGTFRDEVGRAITSIGDEAVPHLVRASADPPGGKDDDPAHLRARYAAYNLDQLDRLSPGRALRSASTEPRRLIDLLDAYGDTKPGDAAAHLLDWVDDPSADVRMAARSAFEAYVTGPPPRMKVRQVRRLGGKTERRQAYLSYRALAANAIWSELEGKAPQLLEEPCETRREDGSYNQRCIEQPARLARAWFESLDQTRRSAETKELAAALDLAASDAPRAAGMLTLMIRNGTLGSRHERAREVSEVLLRAAEELGPGLERAGYLRTVAAFIEVEEPDTARSLRARAFRNEASSPGLTSRGKDMLSARARELAPSDHEPAGDEASAGPSESSPRDRFGLGLLYILGAFGCSTWLGRRLAKGRALAAN